MATWVEAGLWGLLSGGALVLVALLLNELAARTRRRVT